MTYVLSYGADILVIIASLGAMIYCMVLSRRLSRLTSFDKGLGSAIAVMSSQVDEMKSALHEAKSGSDGAGAQLTDLVHQAREISSELEMMIAACHDFTEEAIAVQTTRAEEEEAVEETAPVFGSRRIPPSEPTGAEVQPLFRRRAGVNAG